MKTIPTFLAVFCFALVNVACADITVSLFGTGQFSETSSTFTTNTQTATTFEVIGNDFGSAIYGDLPSPVNILGSDFQLKLTATFVGTAASNFQIDLFDADGNDRLYQANFSAFTQNVPTTVILTFISQSGAFDNNVTSFGLLTAGSGASVDLKMDTLLAVPEPSTYALLGIGLVILVAKPFRRKFQRFLA